MRSEVQLLPAPLPDEGGLPQGDTLVGAIAQLVERLLCKQDVGGSNPSGSTQDLRTKVWPVRLAEVIARPFFDMMYVAEG